MKNFIKRGVGFVRENGIIEGVREMNRDMRRGLWRLYYGGELADWVKWYFRYQHPVINVRDVSAEIPSDHFPTFHQSEVFNEKHLIHEFMRFVEDDDVFWDVGANIGSWSVLVGQKVTKTVCFEPDSRVRPTLEKTLDHNDVTYEIMPCGLGDSEETIEIRMNDRWGVDPITLDLKTANSIIEKYGIEPPTVMKIDVEGFEGPVLEGFGKRISDVRRMLIEIHPAKMPEEWTDKRVIETLEETHEVNVVYDRGNQYHIEAINE